MTIIASANLGFPLPGATIDDERLADIGAVRSALVSLDTSVSDLIDIVANPSFTGSPTAPTPVLGDNSNILATTAFVNAEIAADAAPIEHVGAGDTAHTLATTDLAGFMSAADKLKLDGIAEGASGGGSTLVEVINVNTTAVSNTTYIMTASLILTLPLDPVVSDAVHFSNRSNTNTIVIARNGQNIMGLAEDMSIDISSGIGSLVFIDATRGWILF